MSNYDTIEINFHSFIYLILLLISLAQRAPLLAELLADILKLNARILAHHLGALLLAELHEAAESLLSAASLARLILLAATFKVIEVAVVVIERRSRRTRVGIGNGHRKSISRLKDKFVIHHSKGVLYFL